MSEKNKLKPSATKQVMMNDFSPYLTSEEAVIWEILSQKPRGIYP